MALTLLPKYGYGPNAYIVRGLQEFYEIVAWMEENDCAWWQLSSGPEGIGFQVKSNIDWFNLKWI